LSTLSDIKKDLEDLSKANNATIHAVDNAKQALDEAVQSFRQRVSHDGKTLAAVVDSIKRISKTTTETRMIDTIMKRLRFDQIHLRELNITDANQHTFRWLLYHQDDRSQEAFLGGFGIGEDSNTNTITDYAITIGASLEISMNFFRTQQYDSELRAQEKERTQTRERFLHWLRSENGLFYISGKPGSGKSTLMKFICSDNKTREELKQWAASKTLIFARFFFWAAGSVEQRSLEGLYRAILWETLRECPSAAEELFPEYWQSLASNTIRRLDDDGFTMTELRAAFGHLVRSENISQRHKMCIFVDGLDEYTGDHWDIAKELVIWSQNPNIKICVSCRPHNEFEHHFGQNLLRQLRLHQLTRSDMIGLIRDKLFDDERSYTLRDQHGYTHFEKELVERAEGVFLWLTLAIKDLLDGLGSAYSVSQLRTRLATVPSAVEDIYAKLLDSISSSDRRLASRTLLAALELQKDPWWHEAKSDIIFSFLDDLAETDLDRPELSCKTMGPNLTDEEMRRRCEAIKRRINKRCKGLLQVSPGGWFNEAQVFEPVHRTMLDYLNQPETIASLRKDALNFDPHLSLLLCHIHLLRVMILGAQYHLRERRQGPEGILLDCYRLSRQALHISNQIMRSIESVRDPDTCIRLITAFGDAGEGHFPNFRNLRNSNWPIPTSPGVWKRSQLRALFSGHDNSYETSFTSLLVALDISEEKWDLILTKTKYSSSTATAKLLLAASVKMSQTMGWNERRAKKGIEILKFFLQYKLDPNGELPGGIVCIDGISDCHTSHGDYWTSWTASLFSAVSFVTAEEPNPYLVELVEAYLSNGADKTIALVGYLIENDDFEVRNLRQPLPIEHDYSGPFYIDVIQLLQLWKSAGVQSVTTFTKESGGASVTSWISQKMKIPNVWRREANDRIRRLDITELGSKVLVVLTVVPLRQLSDIVVEELERLLQSLQWQTENVRFVNMI
jgi:hypothetical protein